MTEIRPMLRYSKNDSRTVSTSTDGDTRGRETGREREVKRERFS